VSDLAAPFAALDLTLPAHALAALDEVSAPDLPQHKAPITENGPLGEDQRAVPVCDRGRETT